MKITKILSLGVLALSVAALAPAQKMTGPVSTAFQKLVADTKAALADSAVTPAQFETLKSDLASAVAGANKPSAASVALLKSTVEAAKKDGTITSKEKMAIQRAFAAVLASANVAPAEAAAIKADLLAIVSAANVTQDEAMLIISDLRALLEALPEAGPRP